MAPLLEQSHLAKEISVFQDGLLSLGLSDDGLAARHEVHGAAGIARANDRDTWKIGARVEQLGDLRNFGLVHGAEQVHTRHHAPGDDELMPTRFLAEAGGDDGDGQREHAKAENHDDSANNFAEGGDRHDVAIADRGEGRERPPGRSWNQPNFQAARHARGNTSPSRRTAARPTLPPARRSAPGIRLR